MSEAFITGAVAIIVCVIGGFFQMKQVKKQNDKTVAMVNYYLECKYPNIL